MCQLGLRSVPFGMGFCSTDTKPKFRDRTETETEIFGTVLCKTDPEPKVSKVPMYGIKYRYMV